MAYLQVAIKGYFAHDTLDKGRFSLAVLAYECYFFATFYGEVNIVEHVVLAVIL